MKDPDKPRFVDKHFRMWINGVELFPAPEWRCDQAPNTLPGGWSSLTPGCITEIESALARRILDSKSKVELLNIRKDVKTNPHLHQRIKSNLLLNIRNYLRMY